MSSTAKEIPVKGWAALKRYIRYDALAGFSVSLIAMPLCLGIALASGVPPIAGLFTAIVGGMLASRISGSNVTISGPAAGLIVITLSAVESLGNGDTAIGYPFALAAIVVAGAIVALFGLLKVGKLGDFFPSAVVHGMLAAIGVIIMIKQFYPALGVAAPKGELIEVAAHIPVAITQMNPEVFLIALAAIAVLIIHPRLRVKWLKMIPAPLIVLLVTIPMAHAFDLFHEHHYHFMGSDYELGPKYLVNLPDKIADGIVFPDFGLVGTGKFWIAVISFALVSGIESLLSAKAVDALDPWKRRSNLNMDLVAMGGGSAMAGLIGGLPMISEIVRSSANINNGARTQWANFFHGTFLLVFLLALTPIIEQIPMSALAAMLIFTGFRLASPKEFIGMAKVGPKQLAVFIITLLTVIATDLLIGIGVGIVAELVFHLLSGAPLSSIYKAHAKVTKEADTTRIRLDKAIIFTNYLSMKSIVGKQKGKVILDFEGINLLDHTVMHNLHNLQDEMALKGIDLTYAHMTHLNGVTEHPLSDHTNRLRPKVLKALTNRQKDWAGFAVDMHLKYQPDQQPADDWQGFNFLRGETLLREDSVTTIEEPHYTIRLADVKMSSGALLTASEQTLTLMLITPRSTTLPRFTLEKETLMDRLFDSVSGDDIDFEAFKLFSDQFLLRGEDETAIRHFFTDARIQYIEQFDDLEMESNGRSILIRHQLGTLPIQKLESYLRFGKTFSRSLTGKMSLHADFRVG